MLNCKKLSYLLIISLFVRCSPPNDYYIDCKTLILTSESGRTISRISIKDTLFERITISIPNPTDQVKLNQVFFSSEYGIGNALLQKLDSFCFEPLKTYTILAHPYGDRDNNEIIIRTDAKGVITKIDNGFVTGYDCN